MTPHPNDMARLFGIIMTLPRMRAYFERLCDGITNLEQLDSPALSLPQIFADIYLAFNNDNILIQLPDAANNLENIHSLDPNDQSRISIDRDRETTFTSSQYHCTLFIYCTHTFFILYIIYEQICGRNTFGIVH